MRRERRLAAKVTAGAATALGATVVFAPAAQAGTFTVDILDDALDNACTTDCSIRDAVYEANQNDGDDTILFESGLTGTIVLDSGGGDIDVYYDSLTIQGPGADVIEISGDDNYRIFTLYDFDSDTDEVVISGLTLTNGYAAGNGGAIATNSVDGEAADLSLDAVVLDDNSAGGVGRGGALYALYSALTITNSQITNNDAPDEGGGISSYYSDHDGSEDAGIVIANSVLSGNDSGDDGGAARLYGAYDDILITNSTFSGNYAAQDGGALTFYGNEEGASLTIDSTTVSDNEAALRGGGAVVWASENHSSSEGAGPTLIQNSTFSGNTAGLYGGGIWSYNADDTPRAVRNSTIVDNTAGADPGASGDADGGGIYARLYDDAIGADEDVFTLSSTIVANNSGNDLGDDESVDPPEGSFDLDFSLVENPGEAEVTESSPGTNLFGVDPALGALASNGGPTQTHLPAATSPVVDHGIANGLGTDQRGIARTFDAVAVANGPGSDGTDIGSVEVQPGEDGLPGNAQCQGVTVPEFKGTDGNDTLTGTGGPDFLRGLAGNDTANGAGGKDCVNGDAGKDKLKGGGGKDKVKGGAGKDRASGGGGKDKLSGQGGKDTLKGGGGKDRLKGGPGKDKLNGGGGKDRFNCGGGKDKVTAQEKDKVSNNCEKVIEKG